MTDFEGFGPDETQKRIEEMMASNTRTLRIIHASHTMIALQRDVIAKQNEEMIALLKELGKLFRDDRKAPFSYPAIYHTKKEDTDLTDMLPTYLTLIEKHKEELKND
jgi:16S rRNA C1402 (ribose-2'-O) methylase RsmI